MKVNAFRKPDGSIVSISYIAEGRPIVLPPEFDDAATQGLYDDMVAAVEDPVEFEVALEKFVKKLNKKQRKKGEFYEIDSLREDPRIDNKLKDKKRNKK